MKLFSWLQDKTEQSAPPEEPPSSEDPEHPISPVLQARMRELESMSVKDVMVPRSLIMALDVDVQLRRVRRLKSSKTLYFPVYKGDLDHILGWVSKQKTLELMAEPTEDIPLANTLRHVGYVHEDATVAELADSFLKSASPFLVVRNSQGSTVGIVPLSEYVELIFGFEMDQPAHPQAAEYSAPPLRSYEI